jgi:predicted NBD/HSP70 family sugar kinase
MASESATGDFGNRGWLETLVGLDTVVGRWRGDASGDLPAEARALLRAAGAGDAAAGRAIGDAATLIGMAAAHVSLVIDPSLLVLSGPLVGDDGEVLERVRTVVSRVMPRPPKVVRSTLGEHAMLTGSLLVATQDARERLRRRLRRSEGQAPESTAGGLRELADVTA